MTYPTIMPALTLDFQNSQQLDPRVTFSRSSGATYINSAGLVVSAAEHEPRFDHDPVTGECLGLLIEESRTNRVLSSQSLPFASNPAYWTVTDLSTGAPNGEGFARVNCVSFNSVSLTFIYDVSGLVSGSSVLTVSLYARSNDTNVQLGLGNHDAVILGTTPALTSEWVRYSGTFTWSGSSTIRFFRSAGSISAGQSFDVCMVSIEAGSFPTSYIPTTTSVVTRSADIAQMTSDNFSSWYNQSEGTVFADFISTYEAGSNTAVASINNGGSSQRISLRPRNTIYGGSAVASLTVNETPPNVSDKIAWSFDTSGLSLISGSASDLYNSALASQTLTQLDIGMYEGSPLLRINGTISRLTYYPRRLTDSELQTITL